MEALAQSNPVQLKLLLGIVNSMIDNPLLGIITSMDTASFQQVFYLLTEGIIFHIEEEDGHTHLYLTKESTTAFIQLLPGLQPIVEGMLPESILTILYLKTCSDFSWEMTKTVCRFYGMQPILLT